MPSYHIPLTACRYSIQHAAYSEYSHNLTIHLSWQLLFIPPLIADLQLVCGAAWDFAPSSVQAPQYWSSRVPDWPDPNNGRAIIKSGNCLKLKSSISKPLSPISINSVAKADQGAICMYIIGYIVHSCKSMLRNFIQYCIFPQKRLT